MYTKEELLGFNELLLGRGMPTQQDGIGYNKADYNTCSTYFYGLSDAQLADLAKRLIKYCNTQLGIDKDKMLLTAEHLLKESEREDRSLGVSIMIKEEESLIGFRYNEVYIRALAKNKGKYIKDLNSWVIPNNRLLKVLLELESVGADVKNAQAYAMSNEYIVKSGYTEGVYDDRIEVLVKNTPDNMVLLKFQFNKDLVDEIKKMPVSDRQYNPDYKFWAIKQERLEGLRVKFGNQISFKVV